LGEARPQFDVFYETKANLNRQQMETLAAAGVRWIQPGLETMQDDLLKLLRKGNSAWMNMRLLKWAEELGTQVAWNVLVRAPGEKDEWYAEMAEYLPLLHHLQ